MVISATRQRPPAHHQVHRYVAYGFTVKNGLDFTTKPLRNLAVAQSFATGIGKHYATIWPVDRDEHLIGTYL